MESFRFGFERRDATAWGMDSTREERRVPGARAPAPRPISPGGAKVRLPREEGALWMALICWILGWAAAAKLAWPPLLIGGGALSLFAGATVLRLSRRLWTHERDHAWRMLRFLLPLLILPALAALVLLVRTRDEAWLAAAATPALLYAAVMAGGRERHPLARMLAVVALTALAPLTYASAAGMFGVRAASLWVASGGFFGFGSLYVMARLRTSSASSRALAVVRIVAPAAGILMIVWSAAHPVMGAPFLVLGIRAWLYRAAGARPDPRRLGRAELAYGALSCAAILAGFWLRGAP
ncbi:MAG: hypothetical protein HY716_07785 [Planctomycetes bacterium]|nr:hypothetical protein [Planctomycetota bacterium]